jgi:UDP-N-acetylmuramate: L-alanyl-gamma-D-glutamyl-meso-diaminopimelate ligase
MTAPSATAAPRHFHLIGIGGTAMASLAGLLREAGHRVTGSDENVYPPMSHQLQAQGIPYSEGYRPENLEPRPDVVVVGNAISRGNPELEAVLDRRMPYTSAAAVVKEEFLRGRTRWRWPARTARPPRPPCSPGCSKARG